MCVSKPKIKAQELPPPPPPPEKTTEELDMTEEYRRRMRNTRSGVNKLRIEMGS